MSTFPPCGLPAHASTGSQARWVQQGRASAVPRSARPLQLGGTLRAPGHRMEIDWTALFSSSVPALELVVRGSAIYWFIFLLFRVVLRRNVGAIAISDVLLVVLIADAAQNGMAGQYDSITDGFILVGTIAAWSYLIDFAS